MLTEQIFPNGRGTYEDAGGAAGVHVVMDLHHQGSKTDAEGQPLAGRRERG
jgi:hypothetical protein